MIFHPDNSLTISFDEHTPSTFSSHIGKAILQSVFDTIIEGKTVNTKQNLIKRLPKVITSFKPKPQVKEKELQVVLPTITTTSSNNIPITKIERQEMKVSTSPRVIKEDEVNDLESDFILASNRIKEVKKMSDNDKLTIYALFKYSINGKCNTECPSIWNAVDRAKWNAW